MGFFQESARSVSSRVIVSPKCSCAGRMYFVNWRRGIQGPVSVITSTCRTRAKGRLGLVFIFWMSLFRFGCTTISDF